MQYNRYGNNPIDTVGVFADPAKPGVLDVARRLEKIISGSKILWLDNLACALEFGKGVSCEKLSDAQLVITLGGDGTMLAAARNLAPCGGPLLGVNLGRLGFLTDLLVDEIDTALPKVLSGDFAIEERMMYETCIDGVDSGKILGLNEATIDKGGSPRILHISVYVSGCPVSQIGADGLIVATPTGSTAYSMAAGGAILSPQMNAFIITAIAPYTLSIRPLIVDSEDTIEIRFNSEDKENPPKLTIDGQICFLLKQKGSVLIGKSNHHAKFATYHRRSFYDVLRTKLGWGPPPPVR